MAVKVIIHGNKRVVKCSNCDCLFEYEKEDVKTEQVDYNEYEYYVSCPDCKCKVKVSYFK